MASDFRAFGLFGWDIFPYHPIHGTFTSAPPPVSPPFSVPFPSWGAYIGIRLNAGDCPFGDLFLLSQFRPTSIPSLSRRTMGHRSWSSRDETFFFYFFFSKVRECPYSVDPIRFNSVLMIVIFTNRSLEWLNINQVYRSMRFISCKMWSWRHLPHSKRHSHWSIEYPSEIRIGGTTTPHIPLHWQLSQEHQCHPP